MSIGTKSILFGAHQFILHPAVLFVAWWKLYSFPWDPRLWISFLVHDLGYIGKSNMDGPEGEEHPYLGARIMHALFDKRSHAGYRCYRNCTYCRRWYNFTAYHSRFLAKRDGVEPSALCAADKLATAIIPGWLYLPMVRLTGEIKEYKELACTPGKYTPISKKPMTDREWFANMQASMREWAYRNKWSKENL